MVLMVITMLMEICQAPTPRPKALNKNNITHVVNIEMENVIRSLTNS